MVPRELRVVLEKKTPSCSYTFKIHMKYPSMKPTACLPLKIGLLIFQIPSVSGSILYLLVPRRVHLQKPAFGLRISSSWRRSRAATARLSACLGVGRIVVFVNFQTKLDSYTVILICIQIYGQCCFGMPTLDITIKNKMCLVNDYLLPETTDTYLKTMRVDNQTKQPKISTNFSRCWKSPPSLPSNASIAVDVLRLAQRGALELASNGFQRLESSMGT